MIPLRGQPKRDPPVGAEDDVVGRPLTHDQNKPRPQLAVGDQPRCVAPRQVVRGELDQGEFGDLRVACIRGGKASRDCPGGKALHISRAEQLIRSGCGLRQRGVADISDDHVGRTLQATIRHGLRGQPERFFEMRIEERHR
jgi:hypothetical protein